MQLELHLLGRPSISLDGRDLTADIGDKSLAVVAYLALETPPALAREKLANVFWQDKTDDAARYRLRHTLWDLRRDLGKGCIGSDDANCWLNSEGVWVDVAQFQSDFTTFVSRPMTEALAKDLTALADLYRGDFLEGILVREAPMFEEWHLVQRERLQLLYQDVLWHTALVAQAIGDLSSAIQILNRLIRADSLRERSYRALMNIHSRQGDRAAALRVYEQCSRVLASELNARPSAETQRLRDQIAQGNDHSMQEDLERKLAQAETALVEGRPEHARSLVQSARQVVKDLFKSA